MKEKYSITIKDLETGETLVDDVTNAIIGSFNADEKGKAQMLFTSCDTIDLIELLVSAERLVKKVFNDKPELLLKRLMLEALEAKAATEEGGETE